MSLRALLTYAVSATAFLAPAGLAQQPPTRQGTVTGRVTDQATGQPVVSVAVFVAGTNLGAVTNDDGAYTIRAVPLGSHQLRASRIGYGAMIQTVSVVAGQPVRVNFALSRVPFQLEEVVTTATGEQRTRELGTTVAKLDAAQVTDIAPVAVMQEMLSSRVSGVTLIEQSGTVGAGSRIRIRGLSSASLSNDPLIYVDGVKVEAGSPSMAGSVYIGGGHPSFLNDLDPEEIENIEIVKGPSAATLYGTQAANGVIRITTKRGRPGQAQWTMFDEEGRSQDVTTYPGQYYSLGHDATHSTRQCVPWQQAMSQCTIDHLYVRNLLMDPGTSPLTTGSRYNRGLQVRGGTEQVRYFLSGGYIDENGTLRMPSTEQDFLKGERGVSSVPNEQLNPNELQQLNLRANLGALLVSNLDASLSSAYVRSDNRLPQTGDNLQGIMGAALFGSADPAKASNPWGFARPAEGFSDVIYRRDRRFTNSLQTNWQPTKILQARATTGIDYLDYSDEANNAAGQGCSICGLNRQGLRTVNRYTSVKYTADIGATASFDLTSRFGSKTSVGVQWIRDDLDATLNTANVFPPGITRIDAGAIKTSGERSVETNTLGRFVEQEFSIDQRLFLTGALRYDQNSAFGQRNRSAVYPKVSGSWVAREAQTGGGDLVGQVRLRAALGSSGQQPGATDALRYLQPVTTSVLTGDVPAVTLAGLGNDQLKPERSREIETGFDAALFRDRANVQFTYYNKRTTDALVSRVLPGSLGAVVARVENVGVVTNKGVELTLNARLVDTRSTELDLNVELSRNANKLVDLGGLPPITGFGYQNRVGYPLFGLWWPRLVSWSDANHDGIIEPSEVKVSDTTQFGGSSVPTRIISFSPTLTLFSRRLVLSGLMDHRAGYVNLNANEWFQCVPTQNCRALNDATAPLEDQAKAIAGGTGLGAYLEDASFWKFREVSATYTLPTTWYRRIGAGSATLRVAARNLHTWTKFKSWDPEIATQGNDAAVYNFVQLAPPRIVSVRVTLGY
jgi:TonB-linked SusC/RagA family outer membrane protein